MEHCMPDPTFVTTLLALFAPAEKAGEIHGDLLEERARHGLAWYCLQVPLTCVLLALEVLRRQPVLLLVAYALYELALKLSWWVLRPLRYAILGSDTLLAWQQLLLSELLKAGFAFLFAVAVTWLARGRAGILLLPAIGMFLTRNALLYGREALELIPVVVTTALISMLLARWLQLRAAVRSGSDHYKRLQGS
jgi:hypothetical protein